MIIVKRDPGAISGCERYDVDCSASWRENLFSIFPDGLNPERWALTLNGEIIDPEQFDDTSIPSFADVLTMVNRPRGVDPITIAYMVVIAVAAALVSRVSREGSTDSKNTSAPTNTRSILSALLENPAKEGGRNDWLATVCGHYAKQCRRTPDLYHTQVGVKNNYY